MKKDLGVHPFLFPMPVLMIATYDENGKVDVMNMAWGGICDSDMVSLNISADHKTTKNLMKTKAFTIAIADTDHLKEADFFGMASGNTMEDKFERSGLTAVKSEKVNAPVIQEFPVTLECEVAEVRQEIYGNHVLGRIVGSQIDEKVLDENGKIDASKIHAVIFDQFQNSYYAVGGKVGDAWKTGAELMKK